MLGKRRWHLVFQNACSHIRVPLQWSKQRQSLMEETREHPEKWQLCQGEGQPWFMVPDKGDGRSRSY